MIVVSVHAVVQAVARRQFPGRSAFEVKTAIRGEVAEAFEAGRVSRKKPRWALLYGRRKLTLVQGRRCVWDEAKSRCWIVVVSGDTVTVLTSLVRTIPEAQAA